MTTKRVNRKRRETEFTLLSANNDAIVNGPNRKKSFTLHDMYTFEPLTDNQAKVFEMFDDSDVGMILKGCPGTGKTFLAIYLSLKMILSKESQFKRLVIIRSTVPTRDQGFLKGELEEKVAPYERPYIAICDMMFKMKKSYENLKENGTIVFESSSFLRGNTFDDAIILFDEFQNSTFEEFDTVCTRVGTNSKLIVSGDTLQSDLKKESEQKGNSDYLRVLYAMGDDMMEHVEFGVDDIVRSGFVKRLIMAKMKLGYV